MNRAQTEYVVATLIVILLLILFVPAALTARAEVRDDLRRSDITNLKHAAEMFNNTYNFYPAPPPGAPPCTSSGESDSWLFGSKSPLLEGQHIDAIPHDVREGHGHVYTYCATEVRDGQALGYYFEAQLEVEQADRVDLDEDETRNFHYRILHDGNRILYRVCGGTEQQCTPAF